MTTAAEKTDLYDKPTTTLNSTEADSLICIVWVVVLGRARGAACV